MACEISVHERVLFVLWGKPELPDVSRITRAIVALHAERGPIVFIARVPKGAEAPDERVRAAISKFVPELMTLCANHSTVLEGGGFHAAAKRAVLSSMFFMTGKHHHHHAHATVDDVVRVVAPELRSEVLQALAVFRKRGLLDQDLASFRSRGHVAAPHL